LAQIPDPQRRIRVQKILSAANERIAIGTAESSQAEHLRETYGLRALDALHLACAKSLLADVFLTTDDGLLQPLAAWLGNSLLPSLIR
jgi:predicted nucleic acid-binding protein